MTTQSSSRTSTAQSLMWTRVRTFLTDLFQGLYLVVYLDKITAFGESSTGKTFSFASSKTSLILTLMVIVYILTLSALTNLFCKSWVDLSRVVVVNVVTIEEFRSRNSRRRYILEKPEDERPCMFVLDSLGMHL